MIGKGFQYGYVCTGQVFIFLHIPDDPAIVYYHVCVPNLDVISDDENRLCRTAVAQVLSFVIQALCAAPPSLAWHDAAAELDTWVMEYDDILSKIPESVRKDKSRASPYKPQRWRSFNRSPIRTRGYYRQMEVNARSQNDDDNDDDDEEGPPPSPTLDMLARAGKNATMSGTSSGEKRDHQRGGGGQQQRGITQQRIQNQPYCTHLCLLGLLSGGLTDQSCPNASKHGLRHIGRVEFLHLLRSQLAVDRGPDADSTPLYLSGAVGSLFKVRLSAYGYTLVAKGVERKYLSRLRYEKNIYDRIPQMQGKYVPVCLGLIDLVLPYYYDGGEFEYFLLFSWAGRPLFRCMDDGINKTNAIVQITKAFIELHRHQVLHTDAEPRNILYDADNGTFMVIDFERAEFRGGQQRHLGSLSRNGQGRKRKRGLIMQKKQGKDDFTNELQSVVERVSKLLSGSKPSGSNR